MPLGVMKKVDRMIDLLLAISFSRRPSTGDLKYYVPRTKKEHKDNDQCDDIEEEGIALSSELKLNLFSDAILNFLYQSMHIIPSRLKSDFNKY